MIETSAMLESELANKIIKYDNSEGRARANLFIELIEQSGEHYTFSKKERDAFNKLKNCGMPTIRTFPDGTSKEYKHKCHQVLCHKCNDYDRFALGQKVLKKIEALFPRGEIDENCISTVTINLDKAPLGSCLKDTTDNFKEIITDLLKRHLPDVTMLGHFHVATQKTECLYNPNAMPHYHALIVHKHNSLADVKTCLKKLFPSPNAVQVDSLHGNKSTEDNINIYSAYAHNITFKYDDYKNHTGVVLAKYFKSVESLRRGGRNGLRFEPGYRRIKNKVNKEREVSFLRLRERLKRIRQNKLEKESHNKFPKDSCIHKRLVQLSYSDFEIHDNGSQLDNLASIKLKLANQLGSNITTMVSRRLRYNLYANSIPNRLRKSLSWFKSHVSIKLRRVKNRNLNFAKRIIKSIKYNRRILHYPKRE